LFQSVDTVPLPRDLCRLIDQLFDTSVIALTLYWIGSSRTLRIVGINITNQNMSI